LNTPRDVTAKFEEVIEKYGVLRKQAQPAAAAAASTSMPVQQDFAQPAYNAAAGGAAVAPAPKLSSRIAAGVGVAGAAAVAGIAKGSALLAGALSKGSDKIVASTAPCETPVVVPQAAIDNIQRTRMLTKSAVMVSAGLAQAMVGVTGALSDVLSKRVSHQIKRSDTGPDSKLEAVKEVGGATVVAAGSVYLAASEAFKMLISATVDASCKVVEHKFGSQAGMTAREAGGLVQDAAAVTTNMESCGVKGLVKAVGKQTAMKVAHEFEGNPNPNCGLPPNPSQPPLQ
jgi:hypothetical protein